MKDIKSRNLCFTWDSSFLGQIKKVERYAKSQFEENLTIDIWYVEKYWHCSELTKDIKITISVFLSIIGTCLIVHSLDNSIKMFKNMPWTSVEKTQFQHLMRWDTIWNSPKTSRAYISVLFKYHLVQTNKSFEKYAKNQCGENLNIDIWYVEKYWPCSKLTWDLPRLKLCLIWEWLRTVLDTVHSFQRSILTTVLQL
jgi:hypothetical protein